MVADGQVRWAGGAVDEGPQWLLPWGTSLDALLAGPPDALDKALAGPSDGSVRPDTRILAPIERQEVWAATVTSEGSRAGRQAESAAPDLSGRAHQAQRPALFFKSTAPRVRGPGQPVGIRADSTWDVPEPEVGLVATAAGQPVGLVVANDLTSRSIEGENPLYQAQAKIYDGGCALGPCIVPLEEAPPLDSLVAELEVRRDGCTAVRERASATGLRRSPGELLSWLYRALAFPLGALLLTGTGIVGDDAFSLAEGDEVAITVTGLGTLTNPVVRVGRAE